MRGSKELTEQAFNELDSLSQRIFDNSNGILNTSRYENLAERIREIGQEYDVSEFQNFLDTYRGVYAIRKEDANISP